MRSYITCTFHKILLGWRMRWEGHVSRIGEMRDAYKIVVGKPERNRLLGRPRRRWRDNIRIYVRDIG